MYLFMRIYIVNVDFTECAPPFNNLQKWHSMYKELSIYMLF